MRTLLLLVPLLLVGCSSYRADPENIRPVADDRLLAYQASLPKGASIVVNRDMGLIGGGCYIAVKIDRQLAARIGVGEVASFSVPAGTRVVGIATDQIDDTLCGMGNLRREIAVPLKTGQVQRLRIVSQSVGGFDLIDDIP